MRSNMLKHLTVTGILLLLCVPLGAGTAVLVDDPFTDGVRSNSTDTLDINWWNANGISPEAELTIENDAAGIGLGESSMVFTVGSSTVSRKFFGTFGTVDLLDVGDAITLSFDFRYTNIGAGGDRVFRFGLFNTRGTTRQSDAVTSYNEADSDSALLWNDNGYIVALPAGASTGARFIRERGIKTFMGGTDIDTLGDTPAWGTINDTAKHTAEFTIIRDVNDSVTLKETLRLRFTLDKGLPSQKVLSTDSSSTTWNVTTFDEIGFFSNGSSLSFAIDNVKVQTRLTKKGDLQSDFAVDFEDFALLAAQWAATCTTPSWCGGVDIDHSSTVSFTDLALMAENWLYQYVDATPPSPGTMTFAVAPAPYNDNGMSMTATTAKDLSGVEYYFTCTAGGGNDSGWQVDRKYTDLGLTPSTSYTYTVKARDLSDLHNETAASEPVTASTAPPGTNTTPPTPDPMTWASIPFATGSTSIAMTATTATDPCGVEYYFTNTNLAGHDSGWQASPTYTDTNLTPNTAYSYTVKARDPNNNETAVSSPPVSATTTPTGIDSIIGDIDYLDTGRTHKLDLYQPVFAGQRFPGIVIIHGGGFNSGDKRDRVPTDIARTLTPAGFVCVAINYKLYGGTSYPNTTTSWPTNIQDAKSAVKFLRANADTYHVDANNIGVIGASAGGQLAGLVAYTDANDGLEPNALLYPDVASSRVQAFVDLYGVVDQWTRYETEPNGLPILSTWKWGTSEDMLACLPTDCPEKWDASNPVFYITPDDPNTLILHGTADTTVDYYQSTTLNSKLDANGVPNTLHLLPGVNHSFNLTDTGTGTEVINFFNASLKP